MRHPLLLSALFLAIPAHAAPGAADHPITPADLLRMHKGGLKDATILDFLQAYQARLQVGDADFQALAQAGFKPETLQALRTLPAPPAPPEEALDLPLPRFFVGYRHDPAAFPAWYYGPFSSDSVTGARNGARGGVRHVVLPSAGHGWGRRR